MTVVPQSEGALARTGGGGGSGNLYDVLDLILDRGLVIDVFARVSLVGIEILKVDARIVVASVDTYLRFAEACNRLDLESGRKAPAQLTDVVGEVTKGGSKGKTKGALAGAAEAVSDALKSARESRSGDEENEADEDEMEPVESKRERSARRPVRHRKE
ncbi:gas vesicle structural protein GvpA [Streptomyces sp. RS10V-4]|uniref:gas vesicle protein GvpJ n=1 Tax=Streptomyces rhizoryzae TaxID=2932493 RepID=UPI00200617A4|nr:gas vesicle protein GvpJ [Streptomyces rhizoryzae]MCK7624354.1 gas vesicle structural protein GvpA [Streptomyces rhizoryzae]